jgi:hypothetical protein
MVSLKAIRVQLTCVSGNFPMASPSKTTTTNSDSAFNKQADAARDALKNFNTVAQLNAPGLIKTAMEDLVTAMVSFILKDISTSRY